jgi:hypothetical protein
MTPVEQKEQLDETIRRKLQKPSTAVAAAVPVASASSPRDSGVSSRGGVTRSRQDQDPVDDIRLVDHRSR